ncbi:GtrA family protein [Corynebacterium aurimucosum]|uniref:GtrA family protein n=1 Tax=Corynebacterium aurimucosum TaxID=169292 RepID=UPI00066CD52B|nr:GtrA family protein [Corynebacterium aurimucosum]
MADLSVARFVSNFGQFIKFGIVGGSGTAVNLLVFYLAQKWFGAADIFADDPFLNLFGSSLHIRWYHVFSTIAFLLANTWNYQLNRMWTFRSVSKVSWLRGFFPFLLTGFGAFLVSLVILTLLMNPTSPLHLPSDILDNSTGLRTKSYWAQAISIIVAMPINFVINKLWTFRAKPKAPQLVEETEPA